MVETYTNAKPPPPSPFGDEIIEFADTADAESLAETIHQAVLESRKNDRPAKRRKGKRKRSPKPQLSGEQILQWADAYFAELGTYPALSSRWICKDADESWTGLNSALRLGQRGLPGGISLLRLLSANRNVVRKGLPKTITLDQIAEWADAWFARTGEWPRITSGDIPDAPGETWSKINCFLKRGAHGSIAPASLPQYLKSIRGAPVWLERPRLTEQQVLEWADEYYLQHGRYPALYDGTVRTDGTETWSSLDQALKNGHRGLPGGRSLAQLLAANRTVVRERVRYRLTVEQILEWADAHKRRTGAWPRINSGPIPEAPGKTWSKVNGLLFSGATEVPPPTSLAKLLEAARGARMYHTPPSLTEADILAWADQFHAHNGRYPFARDGEVGADIPENWRRINTALHRGLRGLSGGSSLADLLQSRRTVVRNHTRKKVTLDQIDAWARAYRQRTGDWPTVRSGVISEAPGETWDKIDGFLRRGAGGALGKSSLTQYLDPVRSAFYHERRAPLTVEQIIAWAEEHRVNKGSWPTSYSGDLPHAPGENWSNIAAALHRGHRSLPWSGSLAELLRERSDAYQKELLPPIDLLHLNAMVLSFYQREGRLPNLRDPVADVNTGDTWATLDRALRLGGRGLAGCGFRSLTQFLLARFPRSDFGQLIYLSPRLTEKQILQWADAHRDATGGWPTQSSGDIAGAGGETWAAVNAALKNGRRGLTTEFTLASFLEERRGVPHPRHRPLEIETILAWADSHFNRTGTWPKNTDKSLIPEAKDTNWLQVDGALKNGSRGLPGGCTLARLLRERRGPGHADSMPNLNLVDLEAWCLSYARRYGRRPDGAIGEPIHEAPGETWSAIDTAFLQGARGLLFSGYISLADFMNKRMGPDTRAGGS